ncbi:MAG TPA: LPS biosynthesis glycosyltransferase, partial [Chloroflexota bacterium]
MTLLHRQPIRRIAMLRALYLGDLLLAVPALRALRAGFPEAEITLISLPWAQSFAQRFGRYVDRFVAFEGYPGLQEVSVDPERSRRFVEEQRGHDYDLVIQMHGSGGQSNPCALALGGRMTAGFYLGEAPPGLDIAGPYPEHLPEVLRNIELVRMLGCPDRGAHLEFPVFPGDREAAEELLRPEWLIGAPLVGIHGGAKTQRQRWPAACFARVADTLVTRTGARIV